jgi:hypothetical protein
MDSSGEKLRKTLVCIGLLSLILIGCGKNSDLQTAQTGTPVAASANTPGNQVPVAQPAPGATEQPHNYAMVEADGTYGYEQGLSEEDVRNGRALKALMMMRYVGNRDGTYVILVLGTDVSDSSTVGRISCQAPCEFAKSETVVGDTVLKTETLRLKSNSLLGNMMDDAIAGRLKPYGVQRAGNGTAAVPYVPAVGGSSTTPAAVSNQAAPAAREQSVGGDIGSLQTSFDCSKPGTVAQFLICGDPGLAASDRELADLVQQARNAVPDQAAFSDRIKKQWNYREQKCKDRPCLAAWYAYEKDIIQKIAQTGDVNAK